MTTATDMQTVMFVHSGAENLGHDRALLHLIASLDRAHWNPVVLLPRRGPIIGPLEALDAAFEVGPTGAAAGASLFQRALGVPSCLRFVRRMARRWKPAVVHTHGGDLMAAALAARLFAPRHVWHVERPKRGGRFGGAWTASALRRFANQVICGSKEARRELVDAHPSLAKRVRVIRAAAPYTPDRAKDAYRRSRLRARLGIDVDANLVAWVGDLRRQGGVLDFVAACAQVVRSHPGTTFVIAGDPPSTHRDMGSRIDAEVEAAGLRGLVQRVGLPRDPRAVFAAADLIVTGGTDACSSSTVVLEAMSTGRAVVAARQVGSEELIVREANGQLVDPHDPAALATAICTIVGDRRQRRAMESAGRALVTKHHSRPRLAAALDRTWTPTTEREFEVEVDDERTTVVHVVLGKANPERQNGVNQVVHHLATTQVELGMDANVWGLTQNPDAATPRRPYTLRLFDRGRSRFHPSRSLKRAIAGLDPATVVHLHGAFLPELTEVATRLRRAQVSYVVTPHGAYRTEALRKGEARKKLWLSLAERRMLQGARAVQAMSQREADEIRQLVPEVDVVVVPNGQVPLTRPNLDGVPVESRRPVFVFCGRLSSHTKGLDALLDGFAAYIAQRGKGTLWIIGDGEDAAALRTQAEELGIARRIEFCGALFGEAKHARLAAADAFIHPSRHEGMPTAVLEAAALALPLIVTPETNLGREVSEAGAGMVLAAVSADDVRRALFEAQEELEHGVLASRGVTARQMVEAHFPWAQVARRVARELYGLDIDPPPAEQDPPQASAA